jgi:lysophospholipid acyltransferase (LPLAT)-like uncharacterized protein
MASWNKQISQTRGFQVAIGAFGAFYLRLVWNTARFTIEPPDLYQRIGPDLPVIVAMWHGQHFMVPFVRRAEHRAKVLISRHRDGEVNAITAERLGLGVVRGSGNHGGRYDRKGGVAAFRAMLAALEEGYNMALTADVPKISRVCGLGIIKLGRASGRPIYPVAVATSHRLQLTNWDRSAVNLPFGRGAIVAGNPIRVPRDAREEALESYRREVEAALNAATARAYAMVDQRRAEDPSVG